MTEETYINNAYDHLKAYDIIRMLEPLLESGNHFLRVEDGKIKARYVSLPKDTPWIHVKHTLGFDCGLWNQITFRCIVPSLPSGQKFVPRRCQQCWKVCVKPRTLQQLFNLHETQKQLDLPSKCGIEVRESVPGLYGGYFYNKGLKSGMDCYNKVMVAMLKNEHLAPLVDEVDEFGRTTRIILKRACTEYEHTVGDSSKWEITPEQEFIEDMVDNYVVHESYSLTQPEHLLWNIKRRWIEFAWEHGDPTYARYTGGKPLYPAYVTYHQPELLVPPRDEILFRKF